MSMNEDDRPVSTNSGIKNGVISIVRQGIGTRPNGAIQLSHRELIGIPRVHHS
jgi:hypothetical protein